MEYKIIVIFKYLNKQHPAILERSKNKEYRNLWCRIKNLNKWIKSLRNRIKFMNNILPSLKIDSSSKRNWYKN